MEKIGKVENGKENEKLQTISKHEKGRHIASIHHRCNTLTG
jgi:hypothetical protein